MWTNEANNNICLPNKMTVLLILNNVSFLCQYPSRFKMELHLFLYIKALQDLPRFGDLEGGLERDASVEELDEESFEKPAIVVVGHVTSVVALRDEVSNGPKDGVLLRLASPTLAKTLSSTYASTLAGHCISFQNIFYQKSTVKNVLSKLLPKLEEK